MSKDVQQEIERRKALVELRYEEAISSARNCFLEADACDDPYAFERAIESLPVEVLIKIVYRKTFRIMADDNWGNVNEVGLWDHLNQLESNSASEEPPTVKPDDTGAKAEFGWE